ncbi:MAG: 3-deoxy-7-phosphoheptulonate synthase [Elusimicrobiota bacterium]
MILTLKASATKKDVADVMAKIKKLGFTPHVSHGAEKTVIGVIGENAILSRDQFEAIAIIESVTPISKPYKLVSRDFRKENTIIEVGEGKNKLKIGNNQIVIMAGPCSVETKEGIISVARSVKESGAKILRGGAFKPRSSPYAFQGLGEKGLKYLAEAQRITGLPVITEVMNIGQIKIVERYADIIQIGARNIQNFDLLKEVGKSRKPVLLKRGMSTTINEFLMSAEYIMSRGNYNVMLCERGIRTFEDSTRFTLDINAIPVIKQRSHLPIIVDPSHGVGVREYIPAIAKAAIAAGADGLIIEVHPCPEKALSDGAQSLLPEGFHELMEQLKIIARAIGRSI